MELECGRLVRLMCVLECGRPCPLDRQASRLHSILGRGRRGRLHPNLSNLIYIKMLQRQPPNVFFALKLWNDGLAVATGGEEASG